MTINELKKEFGFVTENGKEYVLIQQAYSDNIRDTYQYEALAFCPTDIPDEDGYYDAYRICWTPTDEFLNADTHDYIDEGDACDWDHPDSIDLVNGCGYNLDLNRIF